MKEMKKSNSLTTAQQKVLDFIQTYTQTNRFPPTYDEIADNFGFKSKNAVETHLRALERKGVVKKIARKARGILVDESVGRKADGHLIPIVGTVAAGAPLLAEENIVDYLDLYKVFYSDSEIFALNVKGESMIKAGIMNGDMVVVKKQPVIENGEVGVAILDDEATVKRIFFQGAKVILHPENDQMEDMEISAGQKNFFIAGKVIGVIRRF